jgi:tetratricopeptide (TPR) repeat protein
VEDGRSFLQGTERTYDLILSEPSNPWIAGVANLFTREFYEVAKMRLGREGILAQWIQAYAMAPSDYAMIVRTVIGVFPHYALVRISNADTILLASASPLVPTAETVRAAQAQVDAVPELRATLEKHFKTTDVLTLLLSHLVLDADGLQRLVAQDGSAVINTDLNMLLEFNAPRSLFLHQWNEPAENASRVLRAADPAWFARAFAQWGGRTEQAEAFHVLALPFSQNRLDDRAGEIVEVGLRVDATNPKLLGDQLSLAPTLDAETLAATADAVLADSEARANSIGVLLWRAKKYDRALALFERLSARHPQSLTTWINLALTYRELGQTAEAERALARAKALDPFSDATLRAVETFASRGDGKGTAEPAAASAP